jgi:hypothetical protein
VGATVAALLFGLRALDVGPGNTFFANAEAVSLCAIKPEPVGRDPLAPTNSIFRELSDADADRVIEAPRLTTTGGGW